jgi:hypothetical protein
MVVTDKFKDMKVSRTTLLVAETTEIKKKQVMKLNDRTSRKKLPAKSLELQETKRSHRNHVLQTVTDFTRIQYNTRTHFAKITQATETLTTSSFDSVFIYICGM